MYRMLCPSGMDGLFAALGRMTDRSAIIAGGTDLTIKLHEGRERPDLLVNVLDVKEMRSINVSRGRVEIGAAVNFSELADSGEVREKLPALADAASTVGSKQIRNRGTIAGARRRRLYRRLEADTQPRHDSRQRRQRFAGRRHAARAAALRRVAAHRGGGRRGL